MLTRPGERLGVKALQKNAVMGAEAHHAARGQCLAESSTSIIIPHHEHQGQNMLEGRNIHRKFGILGHRKRTSRAKGSSGQGLEVGGP